MKAVLKVFCPVDEVDAAGCGVAVGEALERLASQRGLGRAVLGTNVEDVSWVLDRDALLAEQPGAVIRGRVVALDAVYVTMTDRPEGGWAQEFGSARTEAQVSTTDTSREPPRIEWTTQQESPAAGPVLRGGFRTWIEGEQVLAGWIVTLDAEQVSPPEAASLIAVRVAVDADRDTLWPLVRDFATSFVPRRADFDAALPRLLAREDDTAIFVAETSDEEVVGYLLASTHLTFLANGPVAWVEEVMVDAAHRKRGVGRVLMHAAEQWATARGAAYLSLATRRAGAFYTALGYEDSAVFFKRAL